jgi:hypothetical protein
LQNKIKNVLAVVQKADADEDNLFKQARERMKDLQSKSLLQVVQQSKRLRDAEGKVKEGAKKINEGYAAIHEGMQFIHSPGDNAFETLQHGTEHLVEEHSLTWRHIFIGCH